MRMGRWNLGLLLVAGTVIVGGMPVEIAAARPRQQSDSLAEAARRAQAEKKSDSASQKVWTNENIPTAPGMISIVGTADTPTASGAAVTPATPAATAKKTEDTDKKRGSTQSELDAAKLDLNTVTTDLDILTRKQILDSQSYYSKPDYASDTDGAAQLKDEQDEVDAKKQQVADAQKKVNDLQDQLAALSGDSSSSSSSTPTDNSSTSPTPAAPTTAPATPDSNSPILTKQDPNYRPGE